MNWKSWLTVGIIVAIVLLCFCYSQRVSGYTSSEYGLMVRPYLEWLDQCTRTSYFAKGDTIARVTFWTPGTKYDTIYVDLSSKGTAPGSTVSYINMMLMISGGLIWGINFGNAAVREWFLQNVNQKLFRTKLHPSVRYKPMETLIR